MKSFTKDPIMRYVFFPIWVWVFLLFASMCGAQTIIGTNDLKNSWVNPDYINATSPYFPSVIPTDGLVAAYRKGDWVVEEGKVSLWRDSGPTASYHATQTTALNQPPINASGTLDFVAGEDGLYIPEGVVRNGCFSVVIRWVNYGFTSNYGCLLSNVDMAHNVIRWGSEGIWTLENGLAILGSPIAETKNAREIFAISAPYGTGVTINAWDQRKKTSVIRNHAAVSAYFTAWSLGRYFSNANYPPNVAVEDLWIYNRVLTDSDITIFRSLP